MVPESIMHFKIKNIHSVMQFKIKRFQIDIQFIKDGLFI